MYHHSSSVLLLLFICFPHFSYVLTNVPSGLLQVHCLYLNTRVGWGGYSGFRTDLKKTGKPQFAHAWSIFAITGLEHLPLVFHSQTNSKKKKSLKSHSLSDTINQAPTPFLWLQMSYSHACYTINGMCSDELVAL